MYLFDAFLPVGLRRQVFLWSSSSWWRVPATTWLWWRGGGEATTRIRATTATTATRIGWSCLAATPGKSSLLLARTNMPPLFGTPPWPEMFCRKNTGLVKQKLSWVVIKVTLCNFAGSYLRVCILHLFGIFSYQEMLCLCWKLLG